jgi:hypothetical protein
MVSMQNVILTSAKNLWTSGELNAGLLSVNYQMVQGKNDAYPLPCWFSLRDC